MSSTDLARRAENEISSSARALHDIFRERGLAHEGTFERCTYPSCGVARTLAHELLGARLQVVPTLPRPSGHDPMTKSYAIDQITDIEKLREVAHRMWQAFADCHAQSAHIFGVLTGFEDCRACAETFAGERETPCEKYQAWQRSVTAGFGSV